MMQPPTHHIRRCTFNILSDSETNALLLRPRLSTLVKKKLFDIIAEIFSEMDPGGTTRIEKLNIHLGDIPAAALDERLEEKLRDALRRSLTEVFSNSPGHATVPYAFVDATRACLEKLQYFLYYGNFPWWSDKRTSFESLFVQLMDASPSRLVELLKECCRYDYVIRRLVFQLATPLLIRLLREMGITFDQFIIDYIADIQKAHQHRSLVKTGSSDFEKAIWNLTLSYLFSDRGSAFNKKAFVKWNIAQIAHQYGMNYESLLLFLADGIRKTYAGFSFQSSLMGIIGELAAEYVNDNPASAVTVIHLVQPDEYEFIVSYASHLKVSHKVHPVVKASSADFEKVVWKFILNYLMKDRGSDFNRKEFIKWNLTQIAAEYNTSYNKVLDFMLQSLESMPSPPSTGSSLPSLFSHLAQDIETITHHQVPPPGTASPHNPAEPSPGTTPAEHFKIQLSRFARGTQTRDPEILAALKEYMQTHPSDCRLFLVALAVSDPRLSEGLSRICGDDDGELLSFLQPGNASFLKEYMKWIGQAAHLGLISGGTKNKERYHAILLQHLLHSKGRIFNVAAFLEDTLHELLTASGSSFLTEEQSAVLGQITGFSAPLMSMIGKALTSVRIRRTKLPIHTAPETDTEEEQPVNRAIAEKIIDYLLKGHTPPGVHENTLRDCLQSVMDSHPQLTGRFFRKYVVRQDIRERWVRILPVNLLVRLLHCAGYPGLIKILSWMELFSVVLPPTLPAAKPPLPDSHQWDFVLGYLATQNSGAFHEKHFVKCFFSSYVSPEQLGNSSRILAEILQRVETLYPTSPAAALLKTLQDELVQPPPVKTARHSSRPHEDNSNPSAHDSTRPPADSSPSRAHSKKEPFREMSKPKPSALNGLKPKFGLGAPRSEGEPMYIENAGLILLHPYFSRYFDLLQLLHTDENGRKRFRDQEAVHKGIHALQYLVDETTDTPEQALLLNKMLCGYPLHEPIAREVTLTDAEKAIAGSLLKGVIHNWPMIHNSSAAALRTFLRREGKLLCSEERWDLEVENKTVDILIDHIPWSISIIKQDWMDQTLYIKWRK